MLRIGHSYDIHQLAPHKPLILGGIEIDSALGSVAHSDGDVLIHVIIESIIGAMGMGDLGTFYPDTDPQYANISSSYLLKDCLTIMQQNNYHIINIDCSIYLETPYLKAYKPLIKNNLIKLLNINADQINIKATRGEGLGYIGKSEGIAASCVVLLEK